MMNIRRYIVAGIATVLLSVGMNGCTESYLDTSSHSGVSTDGALNTPGLIQSALTGVYYSLFNYRFAGNYAVNIGDIPTDISYWNTKTGHWDDIYQYSLDETNLYLADIWQYGYQIVDNSARIIQAANAQLAGATEDDKIVLNQYLAEAYALRAYANLVMVNVFAHQVKVNRQDFSAQPGLVISESPIPAKTRVSRSTVGETYTQILSDLQKSLAAFTAAGGDREDKCYIGVAATTALLARTYLYLEDWSHAKTYAQQALNSAEITSLTYTRANYKALYNGGASNTESMFYLDINETQNWSSNSSGTLWSTYNLSPSPKLLGMYASTDVRTAIQTWSSTSTDATPVYGGGKFAAFRTGNPANATHYLVNAPEMFLIMAEANIKLGKLSDAQSALLTVARRNTAITSTTQLPQTLTALYSFLKDERVRELFQEGFRLWDLRRWGDKASVEAYSAPNVKFRVTNYDISNLVYPIPADEINTGFGVEQNTDWSKTLP